MHRDSIAQCCESDRTASTFRSFSGRSRERGSTCILELYSPASFCCFRCCMRPSVSSHRFFLRSLLHVGLIRRLLLSCWRLAPQSVCLQFPSPDEFRIVFKRLAPYLPCV